MHTYKKLDEENISRFIFHPQKTAKTPSQHQHHDLDIEVGNDATLGCRLFEFDQKAPTIIYFHGNGETVDDYEVIAPLYLANGINLLVVTYRGYGWSSGHPSATFMIKDSEIAFESASKSLEQLGFSGPLFVMGRSLGSASAIEICTLFTDTIKGLIIESGFADTVPLLSSLGCSEAQSQLTEKDGFRNREKIEKITLPTLILHGARDTIIPLPQAERLQSFSGARAKKFFVIPGADHNSVMDMGGEHYFSTILSFINDITGQNTWRKRRKRYKAEQNNDN